MQEKNITNYKWRHIAPGYTDGVMQQNRIKELRQSKGMTQGGLALATGFKQSEISMWESGSRNITLSKLAKIAEALGVDAVDLVADTDKGGEIIPVVGYVGAGAEVFPIDDHAKGFGMGESDPSEWGHFPQNMKREKSVALEVRGDSMMPLIQDGDLIFYDERLPGVPLEFINTRCVVWLLDGKCLVKWVRAGSRAGHYTLDSINPADDSIKDALVQWSAKVKMILPR